MITKVANESFIASLKSNPAYAHINIDGELWKMDRWLARNPGRVKSKLFMTKWLDKIVPPAIKQMPQLEVGKMFIDAFATTSWDTLDKRLAANLSSADIRLLWKHGFDMPHHRKQFFIHYNLTPPMD